MILRNIYHPTQEPETHPRVPLSTLRPGQSYVHYTGGVVRTVHDVQPGIIKVIRHDPEKDWHSYVTDPEYMEKGVIVVPSPNTRKK